MNPSFEVALAARLLWMDVRCLEHVGGLDADIKAAVEAAYEAVDQLAVMETGALYRYGSSVPPLFLDVPELATRYKVTFEGILEAERVWSEEYEYHLEREQYLRDIADTYAEIDRDLLAGWFEDCRDDGHL
ncbi:hypothetical protein C3E97_028265 [Pseudomonas sp. MWU12-2115]|uniref:hypothetical protein n=1 Tax=unclassified Pseudomonas TaxID=196821 RepID=UPI000CD4BF91|nr:hypothetical protein [Pseudomonas sp. MWU12-2020]RBB97353.1 hypothetical protein C3E97_028265 [Pseudomonas sp. MWU12-2115]